MDMNIWIRETKEEEALELIDMGYIQGCNAIITLEKAKQYVKGK